MHESSGAESGGLLRPAFREEGFFKAGEDRCGPRIDLNASSLAERVLSETTTEHANRRNSCLPGRLGIVGCIANRTACPPPTFNFFRTALKMSGSGFDSS